MKKSGKARREKYREIIRRAKDRGITSIIRKEGALSDKFFSFDKDFDNTEEEKIPLSMNEDTSEGEETEAPKKSLSLLNAVCVFTVVFSLLAAIVLTGAAVFTSFDGRVPADDITDDIDAIATGSGDRVVYIREYDSESGILTASEIYEKQKGAVVSLIATADSGASAIGSGFIYSSDGYIVTAEHVISGADRITVITSDNKEYAAHLISGNEMADVALLKIDAEGLPFIKFGSSERLLVGERVYAIGTPAAIEYAGTLSSGEITYLDRKVDIYKSGALEKRMTVIQTNAQLSKGNSGCPLFDEYGNVIGMVTMKLQGDADGIGFALPSDGIAKIVNAMKEGSPLSFDILSGLVTAAPSLGITGETVLVGEIYGYRIGGFSQSASSASLLLKEGDILIEIDSSPVRSEADITSVINKKAPRDTVAVRVIRSGQVLTYDISLGESALK